jgi:hypothetical protein
MLNTYSNIQILALVSIAMLVLAYMSFLVIVFARYHKRSKQPSEKAGKQSSTRVSTRRPSANPNQVLPNGWRRKDYHRYGYSDFDIEFLGLGQPSAPDPFFSGWAMADMADSDLDGEIGF